LSSAAKSLCLAQIQGAPRWQRVINLKPKNASLKRLRQTGISVKSDFTMKPGTYLVRLVVRDSEGAQMAAMNRGVEIPQ
jgi:hypothetical protein